MKIEAVPFQTRFLRQAAQKLGSTELQAAVDRIDLSSPSQLQRAFDQFKLALEANAAAAPLLAAIAQDVARSLITPAQEQERADGLRDAFESRFVPNEEPLQKAWQGVQKVTASSFPPPREVNSPLVYAQADSHNLFIGKEALSGELSDPNVLTFSLAHEEGHRQHRDTAGALGLNFLGPSALRAGRHQNERRADEFAARVAAKLGCAPLPILRFLLGIPEDNEHPPGLERARLVRQAMAEEGLGVSDQQWRQLVVLDPRGRDELAKLGSFHVDPASWQPLNPDRLAELRVQRLEYIQHHIAPGSLVVLDQFFQPSSQQGPTHGQMVSATARNSGHAGPLVELDTTYSLESATAARLEKIQEAQQQLARAGSREEIRQALRDLSVLKRGYALDRSAESLEQLVQAGLRDSAVNLSLGHNAADELRRLLQKAIADQPTLIQLIKGFCDDPALLQQPQGRARLVENLAGWLQETLADPRWQASKARYDEAVGKLAEANNAVVVAAGNEGDIGLFLEQWCSGQTPNLPAGFENNDFSNPTVTVVGALDDGQRAVYSSHDQEIDCFAEGRSLLGDEKGTSFAAPRVAAQLATKLKFGRQA
ncbi:MAG: S8 family serine peptidase [Vulcanimicrobiota bacterium]